MITSVGTMGSIAVINASRHYGSMGDGNTPVIIVLTMFITALFIIAEIISLAEWNFENDGFIKTHLRIYAYVFGGVVAIIALAILIYNILKLFIR